MAELDDRGRDAADSLLAKVTAVARAEATRAVAEKLNNVVEGGRLNWDMLTQWGHHLLDDGTEVPIRPKLDLVGFTVADDPTGDLTRVTGGGGSVGLPRCAAYCSRDASFNPTSGSLVQVPLDRDQYDPDNWHDAGTSSPYVILPADGDYLVLAEYRFSSTSSSPRITTQLWLYGGTAGTVPLDRDEDTYHQDDEHTGGWGNDAIRTLRVTYADHFVAGTKLNTQFRHLSGATDVQFQYENDLGPRLLVTRLDGAGSGGGGTGGDWVELASHTVPTGGGEGSVDFPSLPQTYRSLVAVGDNIQYVTYSAVDGKPICFLANAWNGNDYVQRIHRFGYDGATINDVVTPTPGNSGAIGYAPGPAGDEPVSSFVCWFPGYTNTTKYKTYHGHAEYSFGSTTLGFDVGGFARLGSAAHINVDQLTFYANYSAGGAALDLFAPGSRITIYGVR